jgi:chromosome segregation ATPase
MSEYQEIAMLRNQIADYRQLLAALRHVLSVTDEELRTIAGLLKEARAHVGSTDTGLGQRIDAMLERYK